jgi:hypothetical protein
MIGSEDSPLLLRWHLIPRNPVLNLYLHLIQRSDKDKELHDHPWANLSILLINAYREVTPDGIVERSEGDIIFRHATALHRLELINDAPVVSLFITGPKIRQWGFWCPQGWVSAKDFVKPDSPGEVGKGCG